MNFSDLSKAQRALLVEIYQAERAASKPGHQAAVSCGIQAGTAASIKAALYVDGKRRQTARNLADKDWLALDDAHRWRPGVALTTDGRRAVFAALSAPTGRRCAISQVGRPNR